MDSGLVDPVKNSYDDKSLKTITGTTPLEEAANRGSLVILNTLLRSLEPSAEIEARVCVGAAGNKEVGKDMMTLILDRRGREILITEDVVKAAAGNKGSGKDIVTLLLDRRGNEIVITEEVVKAAATNWNNGTGILNLLLDKRGAEIKITEDVVKTVAKHGSDKAMTLLLNRRGHEIYITNEIVNYATTNLAYGENMITLLLEKEVYTDVEGEDGRTPLARAVAAGWVKMARLLLRKGADPNSRDFFGRTPLMTAAAGGYVELVKLFLATDGIDIHIEDKFGRNALSEARQRQNPDIVRLIVQTEDTEEISHNEPNSYGSPAGNIGGVYCDVCLLAISGYEHHYHCVVCKGSDFDICCYCFESGASCFDPHHQLNKRMIEGSSIT
jgi:ankyrin repeat protein